MESHASEESIASAAPQIQTRPLNQNLNTTSNEELAESSDAELMHDPNMDAAKVIVSPKSSMISSRLAEPETADIMSHRIMEFWINHEHEVAFAIEKFWCPAIHVGLPEISSNKLDFFWISVKT